MLNKKSSWTRTQSTSSFSKCDEQRKKEKRKKGFLDHFMTMLPMKSEVRSKHERDDSLQEEKGGKASYRGVSKNNYIRFLSTRNPSQEKCEQ